MQAGEPKKDLITASLLTVYNQNLESFCQTFRNPLTFRLTSALAFAWKRTQLIGHHRDHFKGALGWPWLGLKSLAAHITTSPP